MSTKNGQELPKDGKPHAAKEKRSKTPGKLSVVATPIGNLEDASPRVTRTLLEADGILCEDTRVTLKLLHALGISRPLTGVLERSDQHSTEGAIARWVDRLLSGENLAIVSDAGTPAISDPGAALVSACGVAGIEVVVIPGPSALAAFLSGAGFESGSPLFRGFFPRKNTDRSAEWEKVSGLPFEAAVVWFESPERIEEAVEFLAGVAGNLSAVLAKELTKRHEKFYRGSLKNIASHIQGAREAGEIRGEWVIGVRVPENLPSESGPGSGDWGLALRSLLSAGISASRAAKEVSHVFGISKKIVYSEAVNLAKVMGTDFSGEEESED